MEEWGHMTTVREVVRGDDSPIGKHSTKVEGTVEKMKNQR